MKSVLWIALLAALALAIRTHNVRHTLVDGQIFFVDADCYSRMTRAATVDENPGTIVRHQTFENYPEGVDPHTTAPLDYLIVGLKWVLQPIPIIRSSILGGQVLDVAGALISPLLGFLTAVVLAVWARWWARQQGDASPVRPWLAASPPFLFAVSPILVHGTLLGRPDHQSLLILLVAIALGAEWARSGARATTWAAIAGTAWGVALWVSVYEPLILLLGFTLFRFIESRLARRTLLPVSEAAAKTETIGLPADPPPVRGSDTPKPWLKWAIIAGIVLLALLIERWHFRLLDESLKEYFGNWSTSIGELRHLDPRKPVLYRWLSYLCLASPILLFLAIKRDRRAISLLGMLLLVFGLTIWQIRWGYFLALIFAMSLPWQLAELRKRWIAWPLLIVALWPTWKEWDEQLFPNAAAQKQFSLRSLELTQLRRVAMQMKGQPTAGFIAPWWLSPPVAYWSGQPGVAGSSHESLGGIVATAKFYTTSDLKEAEEILTVRRVGWVIADDPSRVISTSRAVLGSGVPENPLITKLAESPDDAPPFLTEVPLVSSTGDPQAAGQPQFFRLYRVQNESPQP